MQHTSGRQNWVLTKCFWLTKRCQQSWHCPPRDALRTLRELVAIVRPTFGTSMRTRPWRLSGGRLSHTRSTQGVLRGGGGGKTSYASFQRQPAYLRRTENSGEQERQLEKESNHDTCVNRTIVGKLQARRSMHCLLEVALVLLVVRLIRKQLPVDLRQQSIFRHCLSRLRLLVLLLWDIPYAACS